MAVASGERVRQIAVTLLTEESFRSELSVMGLSSDEVDYQLERARGLHLSVK
jgi:hypothetical protein